jgi:hypothetical protein
MQFPLPSFGVVHRSALRMYSGAIALAIVLTACALGVHRLSTLMEAWVGRNENELVSAWGVPNGGRADLPNGNHVLTWSKPTCKNSGERTVCRESFTASADGTILSWSVQGCPAVVSTGPVAGQC